MIIRIDYIANEIKISNEYVNSLEIENRNYFYRIVNDFLKMNENDLGEINIFDDNLEEINMTNKINVVIDYFNINFDNKKYNNGIVNILLDNIDEEEKDQIKKHYNKLENQIERVFSRTDLSLSITSEIDIDAIIKKFKIYINQKDNLLENLLLLIDIEKTFKINKLLIFINLKQYLSKEEIIELYKYSLYNDVKILLMDSQPYGTTLECEKKLIIDENLEEIML